MGTAGLALLHAEITQQAYLNESFFVVADGGGGKKLDIIRELCGSLEVEMGGCVTRKCWMLYEE